MNNLDHSIDNERSPELATDQLLQVQYADNPKTSSGQCRIEDISEGKLLISWPAGEETRLPLHRDQILVFSFVRDRIAYSFTGLVDAIQTEPHYQITIIRSSAIELIQRRQDFRIKGLIPVEVSGLMKDAGKDDALPAPGIIKTTTCDFSASGIAIQSRKIIREGAILNIKMALSDKEEIIKTACEVIYARNSRENPQLYCTGMRYLNINERDKARIVRYVYRAQLQALK